MHITVDCPTLLPNATQHCSDLPIQTAPTATDMVLLGVCGTTGAKLATVSSLQSGISNAGAGSPEAVVTAPPGSVYWDTTGKALYIKDNGTGATGWYEFGS